LVAQPSGQQECHLVWPGSEWSGLPCRYPYPFPYHLSPFLKNVFGCSENRFRNVWGNCGNAAERFRFLSVAFETSTTNVFCDTSSGLRFGFREFFLSSFRVQSLKDWRRETVDGPKNPSRHRTWTGWTSRLWRKSHTLAA